MISEELQGQQNLLGEGVAMLGLLGPMVIRYGVNWAVYDLLVSLGANVVGDTAALTVGDTLVTAVRQ